MVSSITSSAIEKDRAMINLENKGYKSTTNIIIKILPRIGYITIIGWKLARINILTLDKYFIYELFGKEVIFLG